VPTVAFDTVVQPYAAAGFDGMTDLKTINCHWLHPDGRAESFQSQIGHSWAQRTLDAGGAQVPAEYARDYRHGVASVTGEQLAVLLPKTSAMLVGAVVRDDVVGRQRAGGALM
jgi:hypothetical protein